MNPAQTEPCKPKSPMASGLVKRVGSQPRISSYEWMRIRGQVTGGLFLS
jgi:hypothetical protein